MNYFADSQWDSSMLKLLTFWSWNSGSIYLTYLLTEMTELLPCLLMFSHQSPINWRLFDIFWHSCVWAHAGFPLNWDLWAQSSLMPKCIEAVSIAYKWTNTKLSSVVKKIIISCLFVQKWNPYSHHNELAVHSVCLSILQAYGLTGR